MKCLYNKLDDIQTFNILIRIVYNNYFISNNMFRGTAVNVHGPLLKSSENTLKLCLVLAV